MTQNYIRGVLEAFFCDDALYKLTFTLHTIKTIKNYQGTP